MRMHARHTLQMCACSLSRSLGAPSSLRPRRCDDAGRRSKQRDPESLCGLWQSRGDRAAARRARTRHLSQARCDGGAMQEWLPFDIGRPRDGLSARERREPLLMDIEDEEPAPRHAPSPATWSWAHPFRESDQTPSAHSRRTRWWHLSLSGDQVSKSDSFFPALSLQQRLYGFALCFVAGTVLSLTSMTSFAALLTGNPAPFALKYSAGNILSMLSTGFIVGFRTQFGSMAQQHRACAAATYVLAVLVTFVVTLVLQPPAVIILVCVAVQFCAMIYYVASYIPFGRDILKNCCKSTVRLCTDC